MCDTKPICCAIKPVTLIPHLSVEGIISSLENKGGIKDRLPISIRIIPTGSNAMISNGRLLHCDELSARNRISKSIAAIGTIGDIVGGAANKRSRKSITSVCPVSTGGRSSTITDIEVRPSPTLRQRTRYNRVAGQIPPPHRLHGHGSCTGLRQ